MTRFISSLLGMVLLGASLIHQAFAQQPRASEISGLTETIQIEDITVHHAPSHAADAKKVATFLKSAVKQLKAHFKPAGLDEYVTGFKCNIYLHPRATNKASESRASCICGVAGGAYYADIHLLTPSAHSQSATTHIGEAKDIAYFERLLVHEYAAPVLDRITRGKSSGWRFFQSPRWFIQGYEEYLALTNSNEHSRKVTLAKYKKIVKSDPQRVKNDFGLTVRSEYLDGAMLIAFIHEKYGTDKAQAILTNQSDSFGTAIKQTLHVNLDTFFAAWEEWLAKIKAE